MYTVFKITDYPYMIKCSEHETKIEATAAADWYEEQGYGIFIVKKTS